MSIEKLEFRLSSMELVVSKETNLPYQKIDAEKKVCCKFLAHSQSKNAK